MKNENGITLVSLIVAIIILLILAGVSIFSLSQTNLLKKAKNSENTMKNAQIDENLVLCNYENKINEIVNNSTRENTSNVQQPNSQNTVSGEEHFTGEYFLMVSQYTKKQFILVRYLIHLAKSHIIME